MNNSLLQITGNNQLLVNVKQKEEGIPASLDIYTFETTGRKEIKFNEASQLVIFSNNIGQLFLNRETSNDIRTEIGTLNVASPEKVLKTISEMNGIKSSFLVRLLL